MLLPVVIAAAGPSTRCPGNKLLKSYHGKPLLQWLLNTLASHPRVGRILVVTGAQHYQIEVLLYPFPSARAVHNTQWRAGLSSSLRAGVEELPPTPGFLVTMGDLPFFSPLTLNRMLPASYGDGAWARVPVHGGEDGYPMYFPGETRGEWKHLEGEQGARSLLRRLPVVERIIVDDPGIHQDVDTPEDFPESETLDLARLRA